MSIFRCSSGDVPGAASRRFVFPFDVSEGELDPPSVGLCSGLVAGSSVADFFRDIDLVGVADFVLCSSKIWTVTADAQMLVLTVIAGGWSVRSTRGKRETRQLSSM